MATFAAGKRALAECDVCGQTVKHKTLREQVTKRRPTGVMACRVCWSPDHPQLFAGERVPVDAQTLLRPRPDQSRAQSRVFQWGFPRVGGGDPAVTPNDLYATMAVATVTVLEGEP